jgi:hypothetical protein
VFHVKNVKFEIDYNSSKTEGANKAISVTSLEAYNFETCSGSLIA